MGKQAVIVVDLQNEYLATGGIPLVGIDAAVEKAAQVLTAARIAGNLLVHIRHEDVRPDAPVFVPGTTGVEIIPAVAPADGEAVVVKHYPNAFRDTGLKALLDDNGVERVVLVGAMSHMCIDATARAAADQGYAVTVVHDACATRDLEFGGTVVPAAQVHAAYMAALAFAYAETVPAADYAGKPAAA